MKSFFKKLFGKKSQEPEAALTPEQLVEKQRQDFEEQTGKLAEQFTLDIEDVRAAYCESPEGLARVFNAVSKVAKDRENGVLSTALLLVLIPPLALLTGYELYRDQCKLNDLRDQVSSKVKAKMLENRRVKPKALPKPGGNNNDLKMT